MRICFVVVEIFAFDSYGGFGALTRTIGKHLAKKGVEVYVVMPRLEKQKPVEIIDDMIVLSYPRKYKYPFHIHNSKIFFDAIDADIYHSEEPDFGSYNAMKGAPDRKHIITFQDPRTIDEFRLEWKLVGSNTYKQIKSGIEVKLLYHYAKYVAKRADGLFTQAKYVTPKIMKLYSLKSIPEFLPNPVEIPNRKMEKSSQPTVCFLARWDPRKRPELFFELTKKFPDVKFIAMGKPQVHVRYRERALREEYSKIPNLEMVGFVSEEEKSKILEKSWILINTSYRECLPVSFLEAAAHKCAMISHENPDDFAKNFGYHSKDGHIEDFVKGLRYLLEDDRWKGKGEKGYEYVKEHHELNKVIDQHIDIYKKVLSDGK